jgi:putative component of membrane protein insertase Oxa1/YidC/SpoIIIJ protein YidD
MLSQQASGACKASQLPPDRLVQSVIASGAPEACSFFLSCSSWPGHYTGRFNGLKRHGTFRRIEFVAERFILPGSHRLH